MRLIYILGFLVILPLAHAEVPTLSIATVVDQALERNPDVLSAREVLRQSQANFSFAISKLFPSLNGVLQADRKKAATYQVISPLFAGNSYSQYLAKLNLSMPLYDSGVFAGYSYSKKDTQIKQYQVQIAERTLSESVLELFYSILLDENLLRILKNTYEVDKETLAIAERYYQIGRAQKLDVLQLKTQVALIPPQLAQLDGQKRTVSAQLATLIRDLDASHLKIQGNLVSPDPSWVKKMVDEKVPELPEILSAREQVSQFKDSRDATLSVYNPSLSLTGNIGRQAYASSDLSQSGATSWDVALVLSVPIFNGLASIYQDRALTAQARQYELAETKTTDTVSVNRVQTEKDLEVAETQLASSKEAAVYGRESLKEAQRQYRLQTISYLQYQTSQQAYLSSESGYYQAKYNYIVAVAKYFNAVGVPISKLIAQLDHLSKVATD